MNHLLTINQLSVSLCKTGQTLVNELNFNLDTGQSLILLGQSGSGKTMTCKSIMGILDLHRFLPVGEILFDGQNLLTLSDRLQRTIYGRHIAMIMQNPMTALDPSAKIGGQMMETLRLHMPMDKAAARTRCVDALHEAGLDKPGNIMNCYPYMLSGGMLQRVMIAMALMADARLIVADEPTTALDVSHRNDVVDALLRLRERGSAILLVTHDFAVASRLGGRLLIMHNGEVVEQGNTEQVLNAPKHEYTRALIAATKLSTT